MSTREEQLERLIQVSKLWANILRVSDYLPKVRLANGDEMASIAGDLESNIYGHCKVDRDRKRATVTILDSLNEEDFRVSVVHEFLHIPLDNLYVIYEESINMNSDLTKDMREQLLDRMHREIEVLVDCLATSFVSIADDKLFLADKLVD
jgi:hypothetical protein